MPKFSQPTTLQSAVNLLREEPETRILAGGTDVIVLMKDGAIRCEHLMDVKKIPELGVFCYTANGLEIGGAITCNQILEADMLLAEHEILRQAAATLANTLLRNRATLIGNICNASPGGDMIPACLVLDGQLVTASAEGERIIPLKSFFTGVKQHILYPDELVVKIVLPLKAGRGCYLKKRRIRGHDLAQVGVAGFYGADNTLSMAFGALSPTPVLLEFGVVSSKELRTMGADLITRCVQAVNPIADVRSSKEYRIAMLTYFANRMLDAFANGKEATI